MTLNSPLVSVEWLKDHLNDENLVLLDSTWFLPKSQRSGKDEYKQNHIPGAVFFDYDNEACDHSSLLPRMMPTAQAFDDVVQNLGCHKDSVIIIYDNNGMFSSPRAWWMFKAMGAQQVAVLDGGLIAWQAAGHSTCDKLATPTKGDFESKIRPNAFVDADFVLERLNSKSHVIIDARSKERFDQAHMPGAKNLHYQDVLRNGKVRPLHELKVLLKNHIPPQQTTTFSCGSGVTACILALCAELCGIHDISVYDASWSEWGASDHHPKEGKKT